MVGQFIVEKNIFLHGFFFSFHLYFHTLGLIYQLDPNDPKESQFDLKIDKRGPFLAGLTYFSGS